MDHHGKIHLRAQTSREERSKLASLLSEHAQTTAHSGTGVRVDGGGGGASVVCIHTCMHVHWHCHCVGFAYATETATAAYVHCCNLQLQLALIISNRSFIRYDIYIYMSMMPISAMIKKCKIFKFY